MTDTVLVQRDHGAVTLQLNRPEARNSFNSEMVEDLAEALASVTSDRQVKSIVLTGNDQAFSSGADLKAAAAFLDSWADYVRFVDRLNEVFIMLEEAPIPTVAMVRGFALAGGLELLLCCDIALSADDARIGDQHSNFGLMAGAGGIPRLIRRIGLQPALEIIYSGRWLSGKEAAAVGIVLRSVPAPMLEEETRKFTARLGPKSRTALSFTKRAALAGRDLPLRAALDEERAALLEYNSTSPDPGIGIRAFLSKEKPKFDDVY